MWINAKALNSDEFKRVCFDSDVVSEVYLSVLSGQFTFSSPAVIKYMNGRDREGIYQVFLVLLLKQQGY